MGVVNKSNSPYVGLRAAALAKFVSLLVYSSFLKALKRHIKASNEQRRLYGITKWTLKNENMFCEVN